MPVDNTKTLLISKERYIELLIAESELQRLEAAGVDGWAGRDEAYDGWHEECVAIRKEVLGE